MAQWDARSLLDVDGGGGLVHGPDLLPQLVAEAGLHLPHLLLEPVALAHRLLLLDALGLVLPELHLLGLQGVLHRARQQRDVEVLGLLLLEIRLFLLAQHSRLLPQHPVELEVLEPPLLLLLQLLDRPRCPSKRRLVLVVVLQLGEGVLFELFLLLFVPNAGLVSAILGLEDAPGSRDVDVVAVLGVGPDDEALRALGALHAKLEDLSGVEVAGPGLDGVEADALGHHVLAALAAHVEGRLVAHLRPAHALALHHHERLLLRQVALPRHHLRRVEVLRPVVAVRPRCGQGAHVCRFIIDPLQAAAYQNARSLGLESTWWEGAWWERGRELAIALYNGRQ